MTLNVPTFCSALQSSIMTYPELPIRATSVWPVSMIKALWAKTGMFNAGRRVHSSHFLDDFALTC